MYTCGHLCWWSVVVSNGIARILLGSLVILSLPLPLSFSLLLLTMYMYHLSLPSYLSAVHDWEDRQRWRNPIRWWLSAVGKGWPPTWHTLHLWKWMDSLVVVIVPAFESRVLVIFTTCVANGNHSVNFWNCVFVCEHVRVDSWRQC